MNPAILVETERKTIDSRAISARILIVFALLFLFFLGLLHILRPDLDPSWHFISEYALGRHGWMMSAAFLSLGGSYLSLFIAVRPFIPKNTWSTIVRVLLLLSAAGLVLAGLFDMDPSASNKERTIGGSLHNLGGTLGMAMPIATVLVSRSLLKGKLQGEMRRQLFWASFLAVIGFIQAIILMGFLLSQSNGQTGPGINIGWPNRIEIVLNCVWLIVAAVYILKNSPTSSKRQPGKLITEMVI